MDSLQSENSIKAKEVSTQVTVENSDKATQQLIDLSENSVQTESSISPITFNFGNRNTMAQTQVELLKIASQTLSSNFNGDPIELPRFIAAIKLADKLCEEQNKETLKEFILTKIQGRAREKLKDEFASIKELIDHLSEETKPESSRIIEGKILALRVDNGSLSQFQEKAKELALQYKRSLIVEGFTKIKAEELTISKTAEMCRKHARNDTVKAVLAAAAFKEPEEVVSRMIIEIDNLRIDRAHSSKPFNKYNKNKYHNKNQNNQNGYNKNKYNKNKNGYNKNWKNGNKQNNGQNNRNNGNGYNNREQPIRYVSGNDQAPPQARPEMSQSEVQIPIN